MWVLSCDAGTLLSVVQFDPKKAPKMAKEHGVNDGGDYLLVRARVQQSLSYVADVLEAIYLGEAEGWKKPLIADDKTADYRYRMVVTRSEWKRYLTYEVDGVDYSSHVKEETVRRQPEPKIGNLYSALSATWSAWSKLQPTAPYSGLSGKYYGKPDCKNCGHMEVTHSVKGDKCNKGMRWDAQLKKSVGDCHCTKYEPKVVWRDCTCSHAEKQHKYDLVKTEADGTKIYNESCKVTTCPCAKYEQKPAAAPAAQQLALPVGAKSAEDSAAVFMEPDSLITEPYEQIYPSSIYGSNWDTSSDEVFASSAYDKDSDSWHASWCVFWDGDGCICGEAEFEGEYVITQPAVKPSRVVAAVNDDAIAVPGGLVINGKFVIQEPHVPGETRQESRNRLARNRRARRRARKEGAK